MAVATRQQLKEYCLRKLGKPVINIEVDDTQAEDRIDEALQTFGEKHYDASEDSWVYYELDQDDLDNGYIIVPPEVQEVMQVMPAHMLFSHDGAFSHQFQMSLSALSPWQPFNSIEYVVRMNSYQELIDLTTPTPTFSFVKHSRKLKVHRDIGTLAVGFKLAVKVNLLINPEFEESSDVFTNRSIYNNKWLKAYTTALIKKQWGANLKKFAQISMLGGVTISGQELFDEALAEIEKLEEQLSNTYQEPVAFFVG